MPTHPSVIQFVDLFLKSSHFLRAPVKLSQRVLASGLVSLPSEMLAGPVDPDGYVRWKPVESPINERIMAGIERFLGVPLPDIFKSYLMYRCLYRVETRHVELPEIDPRHPLGWLEWSCKRSREYCVNTPWLIPFASGPDQFYVLFFDTRRPNQNGDYPVVQKIESSDEQEYEPVELFDSFHQLIEFHSFMLQLTIEPFPPEDQKLSFRELLQKRNRPIPRYVDINWGVPS